MTPPSLESASTPYTLGTVLRMVDDASIGAQFRQWVDAWARAGRESRDELFVEIQDAERTGFPWQPALDALAGCSARELWKTFSDDDLGDLADWAHEGDLSGAAKAFEDAILDRPAIDDGKIPPAVRAAVFKRDGNCCQHCGATEDLTIDHRFEPWSEGGSSRDHRNLQVLCRRCNSRKGARPASVPAASQRSRRSTRRSIAP